MRFDYGAANRQSHAGPIKLCGEERIENLIRLLRRQPHAGISDAHHEFFIFRSLRLDGELALPIHILHRGDAVHYEVHHDLLQLNAIAHDLRNIYRQLSPD